MGQILEFCDILQEKRNHSKGKIETSEDSVEFVNCKIEAPDGNTILKNLSFQVNNGSNLLIMGWKKKKKLFLFLKNKK